MLTISSINTPHSTISPLLKTRPMKLLKQKEKKVLHMDPDQLFVGPLNLLKTNADAYEQY